MQDIATGFKADLAIEVKSCMCRTLLMGLRLTLLSKLSPACSSKVLHMQDLAFRFEADLAVKVEWRSRASIPTHNPGPYKSPLLYIRPRFVCRDNLCRI